jgi:hypothetical protein
LRKINAVGDKLIRRGLRLISIEFSHNLLSIAGKRSRIDKACAGALGRETGGNGGAYNLTRLRELSAIMMRSMTVFRRIGTVGARC